METVIHGDYDDITYEAAIGRIKAFVHYTNIKKAELRVSAGGLGFHVRITFDRRLGRGERLFNRIILGDDRTRVILDWRLTARLDDNLWEVKRGRKAGNWVDITGEVQ